MDDKKSQTEKVQREYAAKYTALFNMANDAIFLMRQEKLIDCNPKMLEIFRCEGDEIVGQTPNELSAIIQPDGQNSVVKAMQIIQNAYKGKPQFFEWLCKRPNDNSEFITEVSLNRIDVDGDEPLLMAILRDITLRKQNEVELKQHKEHLEEIVTQRSNELERQAKIIETLYDCTISTNMEGVITEWNKGAEQLFGYSAAEAIGQNVSLIYPPGDLEVLEQQVITPLIEKGTHETEVCSLRKNGDIFSAHLLLSLLYDKAGQPVGMTGYTKDISDRKQIEEALKTSEQRLKLALKAAKAGAWSWDIATNDAFWSDENYKVLGLEPDSAQANYTTWLHCVHPDDRENANKQVEKAVSERKNLNIEFRVVWPNGNIVWINDIGNMIFNDKHEPIGMYGLQIDITERKNSEMALLKSMDEAKRANQAKTDFLANMSHELRTPLNAILGFGQLLGIDQSNELTQTEKDDYIKEIMQAGYHLLDLINQVLDLSSIEAGHLNLQTEPIILKDTLTACISQINAGLATSKNIKLMDKTNHNPSVILSDPLRLKQVLINLLSNAVKYNREGGSVTIESNNVADNKLRISITDTGEGISQENMTKLFDPFERLNFKHGNIEGSGIGLTVSKQLVEAMQGTIGVESTVGKGSTFWFELPLVSK